jgi:ATF/CREB family transcription factor
MNQFGWGLDSSLRSGPLSPAMLAGPTQQLLDNSGTMRTGLTPFLGTSMAPPTPNTAALFAMLTNQTPGTGDADGGKKRDPNHFDASFKAANSRNASVVASTDAGSSTNGSVPPPPSGVQHPAPSSGVGSSQAFATSMASMAPSTSQSAMFVPQSAQMSQVSSATTSMPPSIPNGAAVGLGPANALLSSKGQTTLPPEVLNIAAAVGNNARSQPPIMQAVAPPHHPQAYLQQNGLKPSDSNPAAALAPHVGGEGGGYASNDPTNPLYLLTQAQQLSQTTDDTAVMAAAALSNLNSSSQGYQSLLQGGGAPPSQQQQQQHQLQQQQQQQQQPAAAPSPSRSTGGSTRGTRRGGAGAKRKKEESSEPPPTRAKRGAKKAKMDEESSDEDDDENGMTANSRTSGKAQTEEEKRKNFLERNRQGLFRQ